MKKHIGKVFEYRVSSGQIRIATCTGIEFHELLKKPVFIGISPFGNPVKLSRDDIYRFRN